MRACRITASNFGSVHRTNSFSGPNDLLRQILWPQSYDSVPMRYGSLNEAVALARFSEFLTVHAESPDLPIFIDTPGIWINKSYPFLGGSPDGVVYETLDSYPMPAPGGGATFYRCRRSLLEIKTPFKLRKRERGGDFYPRHRQRNGVTNCVPGSYYDQIMGNCHIMGLSQVFFAVLAPTGLQIQKIPYDGLYVTQHLLPSLVDFWCNQVVPAFAERDRLGPDGVYIGWLPEESARKRPLVTGESDDSPSSGTSVLRPRFE